jgi:hypothetical protein
VFLAFYSLVLATQIAIGVISLGKCLVEYKIPIWNIGFGAVGLSFLLFNVVNSILKIW